MAVSVEGYLLINFTMNVIIIGVIARSRGHVRWGQVLFAAGFGAIYAWAMKSGWFPQLNWPPCQLLLAVVLTLVGVKVDSLKSLMVGTLMLLGGTVFLGGIQMLVIRVMGGQNALTMMLGALIGGAALIAALEARGRKLERWEAQVHVKLAGRSVRVTALIDTGNRLHEPLSGLPVLIIEAQRVQKLLPAGFDPARPDAMLPAGYRLVAYGALGGRGQMACFKPDELLVSYGKGWVRAPDVWVAVYPGKMPGASHALAPAVIGRIQPADRRDAIKQREGGRERWSIPHSK